MGKKYCEYCEPESVAELEQSIIRNTSNINPGPELVHDHHPELNARIKELEIKLEEMYLREHIARLEEMIAAKEKRLSPLPAGVKLGNSNGSKPITVKYTS